MFDFDFSDFDDLAEELSAEISKDIRAAASVGANYAVSSSPVLSGRFKGSWILSNGIEDDSSPNTEDKDGGTTRAKLLSEAQKFDLMKNDKLFIQNNAQSEDGTFYAEDVSYDFSGNTAKAIIEKTAVVIAEGLN